MKQKILLSLLIMLCSVTAWSGEETIIQGRNGNKLYYEIDTKETYGTMNRILFSFEITNEEEKRCELSEAYIDIGWLDGNNVEIPSVIEGFKVTSISSDAFKDYKGWYSIQNPPFTLIPPLCLEEIKSEAFKDVAFLKDIILPSTLVSIGNNAFSNTGLSSVDVPSSVKTIGYGAFANCLQLTHAEIHGSVEAISAFSGCIMLESVVLPNTIKSIGGFEGCDNLESIILPNSLETIYDGTFANSGIKNIQIPDGVSKIGERAFSCCFRLETVELPNGLNVISQQCFEGCSKLKSINIPNSVVTIYGGAFMDCRSLTEIKLSESLVAMNDAFDMCSSLKTIYIPASVKYASAFRECSSLESIVVDAGNPYLDSRNGCNAIIETANNRLIAGCGNTVIPEDVVAIGQMAFAGMTGLSEVTIPDGVYDIGFDAFQGTAWYNSQPEGLVYAGKVAYRVKGQVTNGTDIVLREGTKGIAEYAFEDDYCVGPASITIPESVVHIAPYAFWQCREMTDLFLMHKEPLNVVTYISDTPERTILHVPFDSKESYTAHKAWGQFKEIIEMEPVYTEKCATPTIAYDCGELVFACETEGVEFSSVIADDDVRAYSTGSIALCKTYTISVRATKEGYTDSEEATAALCWIDVEPQTGDITNVVSSLRAFAVLIQCRNGRVTVSGIDDGTTIAVYDLSGNQLGCAASSGGTAVVNTSLPNGSTIIVKIGDKSVKMVVK